MPTRPVTGADVPAWLRRVVVRGLAPDPAARWTTMVDLLTALARPARRSIVLTSVLAISTLGLAGFAVLPATSELCTGRLEGVWDDAQRERVRAAFTDSDAAYAGSTLARVETGLDAYAAGWVATYEQACAATHLAADPSPELLDGRMQCLEQRRRMLGAAVQTLASTDAVVIEHAVGLVTELPAVERCDDAEYVIANVARPQDPQTRERVESVREELAEARALHGAGKYEDAAHVALRASGTAETIGDPALVAEAALRLGLAQADAGHYAEAESSLTAAFFAAREARQVEIAADASTELVAVVGGKLARPREGLQWADQARVEVEQLADPLQDAALASAIGAMHFEAGAHDLASERFEYALAIRERNLDAHHPELAQTLLNLGSVHGMRGDFDRGLEYSERALAIMREALGPDHPSVANAAGNIGNFHLSRGEPELAASVLQEAVTLAEASYGPEHPTTAKWLNNAGISYTELGRFDDALAAHRRALAIREKAFGHDHPMVARSLISIGNLQRARDNYGEARVAYARAATIFESVLGPDHADTAMALNNLGVVHEHEHDYDEALRVYRRAFVIFEAQLGTEHPSVASSHNNLGNVLEEQGALPEALQHHERALAIREKVLAPDHASIPASRKAVARVRAAIARG